MKYTIVGDMLPVLSLTLTSGDKIITESDSGNISWLSGDVTKVTFSTGNYGAFFDKLLFGDQKVFDVYESNKPSSIISFSVSLPGKIKALEITPTNPMVIKKGTLICMQKGVRLSPHRKRGFISSLLWNDDIALQKLEGTGLAFIELDASAVEYTLSDNESMKFDRSAIAFMSSTCKVTIQKTNIIKSFFFGGDSIYQYTIKGPGQVTMQNFNRNRF